jgi:putative ABC transport system substrate-binding protein
VTYFSPSAVARRLALLREALPHVSAIGLLHRRRSDWIAHLPAVEAAAGAEGFRTYRAEWATDKGFGGALDEAIARGAQAFLTLGDGPTYNARHELFELAAQRKVPILYDFPMFQAADELGLMAYYADIVPLFRRVAEQADAILRGGAPGALTLEEPRVFRFMVNLRAARALGLTLPDALIQQADSVLK